MIGLPSLENNLRPADTGSGLAGKTSVINAITSENNTSERISEDTRTVGIDIRSWIPDAQTPLKVHIMDLAGQVCLLAPLPNLCRGCPGLLLTCSWVQAVYSMSHQFFLVRLAPQPPRSPRQESPKKCEGSSC